MHRPGPLQDIPIEYFLSTDPNFSSLNTLKLYKPTKRPRSPGAPSLFSPAKRRVLDWEGVIMPEKVLKSPITSFRGARGGSLGHFADALHYPRNPVRKLNFDPAKDSVGNTGLTGSVPALSTMAPAPDEPLLNSHHLSHLGAGTPLSGPSSPTHSPRQPSITALLLHGDNSAMSRAPPPFPAPDRDSCHYPGFDVYQDTRVLSCPASPHSAKVALIDDFADNLGNDAHKENFPPRKRSKNSMSNSVLSTASLAGTKSEKGLDKEMFTPVTPKGRILANIYPTEGQTLTPTPRRIKAGFTQLTPCTTESERKARRRILEEEADDVGNNEEL